MNSVPDKMIFDKMVFIKKCFDTDGLPQKSKTDIINIIADFCVAIEDDISIAEYDGVVNAIAEMIDYCNEVHYNLEKFNAMYENLGELFSAFVSAYEADLAKEPLISFILPTYSRGPIAKLCIENILSYPGDDIELVVTDNCSPDNTQELIGNIKDKRYKYFRNEKNIGLCPNIVEVSTKATGRFLFLLSDEDKIFMDKIPNVISIIKNNPNLSMLIGARPDEQKEYGNPHNFLICPRGDEAIKSVHIQFYMTGLIFNRYYMNFEDIIENVNKPNYGLLVMYPQVYISLNNILHNDVAFLGDELFTHLFQEPQLDQDVFGEFYSKPVPRTKTFQTFIKIIYGLLEDKRVLIEMAISLIRGYYGMIVNIFLKDGVLADEEQRQPLLDGIKLFFEDSSDFFRQLLPENDEMLPFILKILKEYYMVYKEKFDTLVNTD